MAAIKFADAQEARAYLGAAGLRALYPPPESETAATKWKPQLGKQTLFLNSQTDITIYGGAAGSGKSFGLLLDPLRDIGNSGFGAVIFRKSFPQLKREGGLRDQSAEIYPDYGGRLNETELYWRFPSGAKISFAQVEPDVEQWKGSQIADILFDQLNLRRKAPYTRHRQPRPR